MLSVMPPFGALGAVASYGAAIRVPEDDGRREENQQGLGL